MTYYLKKVSTGLSYELAKLKVTNAVENQVDMVGCTLDRAYRPSFLIGDEINLLDGAVNRFGGYLFTRDYGTFFEPTLESYGGELRRTLANEIFENKSPEYIVAYLIAKYTSLTFISSWTSGVVIEKLVIKFRYISDVIGKLCELFNCQFRTDSNKYAYLEDRGDANVLPGTVFGEWLMEEGTGTTVDDSAGSLDGTITGATWTTGKDSSHALLFGGYNTANRVNLGNTLDPTNEAAQTWSAWIYPTVLPESTSDGYSKTIIGQGESTFSSDYYPFWIKFIKSSGITRLYVGRNATGFTETTATFAINTWYHVAVTINGTSAKVYINGILASSGTVGVAGGLHLYTSIGNLGSCATQYGNTFAGIIDDVRYWKAELTATQIIGVYTKKNPAALVVGNSEAGGNCIAKEKWNEDPNKIINFLVLKGGSEDFTYHESFAGPNTVFTLAKIPTGHMRVTTGNGAVELTGQVETGSGGDFIIDPDNQTVTLTVSASNVDIYYTYSIPILLTKVNSTSITANKMHGKKVDAGWITRMSDARTYADTIIAQYGNPIKSNCLVKAGLDWNYRAGDMITVTDSYNGITAESMYISKVVWSIPENQTYIYVGSERYNFFDWSKSIQDRINEFVDFFSKESTIQQYIAAAISINVSVAVAIAVKTRTVGTSFILDHTTNSRCDLGYKLDWNGGAWTAV